MRERIRSEDDRQERSESTAKEVRKHFEDASPAGMLASMLARRILHILLHPLSSRERRRTTLVMLFVLLIYRIQFVRALVMHAKPHGDGIFSWMYATSLVFDHDIHFANDYAICGRGGSIVDEGGGRPSNPFYFGPALIWTPILAVVRLLWRLPPNAPAAVQRACYGVWTEVVGSTSIYFTVLLLWLAYRVSRRWVSQPYGLAGVLIGAFGTTLVTYGGPMWFYSHLWSALGVVLVMFTSLRAMEVPASRLRWFLVGLSAAFAALMRPQEGVWFSIAGIWLVTQLPKWRPTRTATWQLLRPAVFWTLGFASLYWIQLAVYKKLFGVYWLVPQGKLYVQLRHPHPFLMLFTNYSGLFSWSPLAWVGTFGVCLMAFHRRTRTFGIGLLIACGLETYISSAALSWSGGGTWGQRLLTSLAGPIVVGSAVISQSFGEWIQRRRDLRRFALIVACTFPLMFVTLGTTMLDPSSNPPPSNYGAAANANFDTMKKYVGNPFTFPATAVFSLRYGVPLQRFDDLATLGHFIRHYRTGALISGDSLSFGAPPAHVVYAEGLTKQTDGAHLDNGRGRFLISLHWPWITHIKLDVEVRSPNPTRVHLTGRGFFFGKDLGTHLYQSPSEVIEWALPPDGLTSGINEVIVEADGPITLRKVEFIDRSEHDYSLF